MNRMHPKVDNETRKLVRQTNRENNHQYRRLLRIGHVIGASAAHKLRQAVA